MGPRETTIYGLAFISLLLLVVAGMVQMFPLSAVIVFVLCILGAVALSLPRGRGS
jgi:hypothetical protein